MSTPYIYPPHSIKFGTLLFLASECTSWDIVDSKSHCHAHDKNEKYVQLREETLKARGIDTKKPASLDGEVTLLNNNHQQPPRNPYHQRQQQQQSASGGVGGGMMMQQMTGLIHNEFLSRLASNNDTSETRVAEEQRRQITKQKKDMRITEVLMENFKKTVTLAESNAAIENARSANSNNNRAVDAKENQTPSTTVSSQQQRMDGDIPTISLQNTFFVEGVKIGYVGSSLLCRFLLFIGCTFNLHTHCIPYTAGHFPKL